MSLGIFLNSPLLIWNHISHPRDGIIHAFIWNSKGVSCTLHQIGAAETWVAYRETAGAGVLCFFLEEVSSCNWVEQNCKFWEDPRNLISWWCCGSHKKKGCFCWSPGRVRFTVTRGLERFAIVGRHRRDMEHFVRHHFFFGSSNISGLLRVELHKFFVSMCSCVFNMASQTDNDLRSKTLKLVIL